MASLNQRPLLTGRPHSGHNALRTRRPGWACAGTLPPADRVTLGKSFQISELCGLATGVRNKTEAEVGEEKEKHFLRGTRGNAGQVMPSVDPSVTSCSPVPGECPPSQGCGPAAPGALRPWPHSRKNLLGLPDYDPQGCLSLRSEENQCEPCSQNIVSRRQPARSEHYWGLNRAPYLAVCSQK